MISDDMTFCPECYNPFMKGEGCDHVTCLKCKLDFCFSCCAFRSPILAHGNHFHRKDCRFYPEEEY